MSGHETSRALLLLLAVLLLAGCAANLPEAAVRGDLAALRGAAAEAVDAPDESGLTPLMHAARANQGGAVTLLLDRGAAIDRADSSGRTPLIHAAQAGALAAARILVERGANLAARDHARRYTALTWAQLGLHRELVDFLIDHRATY